MQISSNCLPVVRVVQCWEGLSLPVTWCQERLQPSLIRMCSCSRRQRTSDLVTGCAGWRAESIQALACAAWLVLFHNKAQLNVTLIA